MMGRFCSVPVQLGHVLRKYSMTSLAIASKVKATETNRADGGKVDSDLAIRS